MRLLAFLALALVPLGTGCDTFDPLDLGPGCTCACFSSSAQANEYVRVYPESRGDLDADGDGQACEALG